MRKLGEEFLRSGLSLKVFCLTHHINIHTFRYWQRKFNSVPKSSFVPIEAGQEIASDLPNFAVEIHYPNGVRVKTESNVGFIGQLIGLL